MVLALLHCVALLIRLGTLACSPFHIRFGKFQLLQPFNKKVEFIVNGVKRDFPMKVGEGGEAFFVFETSDRIPRDMQTSPLVSPVTSPQATAAGTQNADGSTAASMGLLEPEPLDLAGTDDKRNPSLASLAAEIERPKSAEGKLCLFRFGR
jgi:phosphatidate phosphatase LPIN